MMGVTRKRALALIAAFLLAPSLGLAQSAPPQGNTANPVQHAGHGATQEKPKPAPPQDHSAHKPQKPYPADIPPITDEDRKAAFPDVHGHTVHDRAIHYFVLFDQLEWQTGGGENAFSWDNEGWVGGDVNRFWFRTEAEGQDSGFQNAGVDLFFGRAFHRWWNLLAGIRQDVRPAPARTWAAVGVQGLAPYWFSVEATAYMGDSGRTYFRFETEYDVLLTNRMILQPLAELEIYGKDDRERGIGAGISSLETGLRLRYEFRRELAPYAGVTWSRKFFGTADVAQAAGEDVSGARFAIGLRVWF